MKHNPLILALLGLSSCFQLAAAARNEKVLLSKIKALTLRSGQPTAARRVSSIPQLKCVGGDAEGLYEIDVMRCTNLGSDYGEGEDVSWSCTADVPKYFKLGSTDVLCEGYASADDPYILKGSCGVEYRLALTDAGYEKYGASLNRAITGEGAWPVAFGIIFFVVVAIILYNAYTAVNNPAQRPRRNRWADGGNGRPWFGGGGDDPPPPYDPRPPSYKPSFSARAPRSEGWRPGFWSGLAAGSAGGYMVGNRNNSNSNNNDGYARPRPGLFGAGGSAYGESSSSAGPSRHETTGFGQTRRR